MDRLFFVSFPDVPRAYFQSPPGLFLQYRRVNWVRKRMRMLFFSSDDAEVEQVGREFNAAGIPCEIRGTVTAEQKKPSSQTELWIRNDRDCHRALMLCVERNIGFARRPVTEDEDEHILHC